MAERRVHRLRPGAAGRPDAAGHPHGSLLRRRGSDGHRLLRMIEEGRRRGQELALDGPERTSEQLQIITQDADAKGHWG